MFTKRAFYPVQLKASGDVGEVEALVSIFGNVDLQGDRVMPGAFHKSLAEWKKSGDPVPVIWSHDWDNKHSHIGVVDSLEETPDGLLAKYTLDIHDNADAAQAFRLLKRRSVKEHSFAYDVVKEHRAKDGANELTELRLIEIGPTLKGANDQTQVIGVKAGRRLSKATATELEAISNDLEVLRGRMVALLDVAEDESKATGLEDVEDEGAEPGDTDSNESEDQTDEKAAEGPTVKQPDSTVVALRTQIAEIRATTGIPA